MIRQHPIRPMTNLLRGTRIPRRLLASFLLLSLVPIGIIGYFAYRQSSEALESKIGTYSVEIMKLLKTTMRAEEQKVELLSNQIIYQGAVQQALTSYRTLTEADKASLATTVNLMLSDKSSLLENMRTMSIYTYDGEVLYDFGYEALKQQDVKRWMKQIDGNITKDIWTYAATVKGTDCILYGRLIYSQTQSGTPIGFILIAVDERMFYNLMRNIDMGAGTVLSVLDGSGTVLSSLETPLYKVGERERYGLMNKLTASRHQGEPTIVMDMPGGRYLVASDYNNIADWYVVSLVPFSYLGRESDQFLRALLVVLAVLAAACLLLALLIARSISNPLDKLVKRMERVKQGDIESEVDDPYRDELGYLSRTFNSMIRQIGRLIEQVKDEQKQKRETELQMLQAQINPHFLFNTLNSLRWTAMLSQADSVSRGLGALAELLRSTIVEKNELVTLRREMRNIDNYVTIQKARYGSSLAVEYDIPEALLDGLILKFLLQPIVENAILHGIGDRETGGRIIISAARDRALLRIAVKDDGQGMDEAAMEALTRSANRSQLAGIGVHNVAERIRLNFGEPCGIEIDSRVGEGTEVRLIVPWMSEREGRDGGDAHIDRR
ncbi:hypothetical protein SD70_07780 [Gordoniibacillus kamchatkensis]|uniref:HAMP domain-containing protein n=1 Tax=Gordoniibacillus kamchatkensis TaxID=1590651 RepID=A0ABR5AJX6_9BACL|nr:sensor histidine kinase [Paenibacillus sp. VKM B-2647]KIL41338.1 hypothetical protein SD70_07780 [Paenibacillus sp. VKM B-2647]